MTSEKRNIQVLANTESKYLTNILDQQDDKQYKKFIHELQET